MPDTTPGKSGTRRTTPPAEPAPAADPVTTEPAPEPTPEPEPDTSGWYRNSAAVALLVMPVGYPSAQLEPGEAVWLPSDPQHPALLPCDAPTVAAADTTGSEQ